MIKLPTLALLWLLSVRLFAQGFEVATIQDAYKGTIGETIKAPLQFRNTSSRPIQLIVKKVTGEIGTSQRNYFCLDGHCLDQHTEDYTLKLEPGQVLNSFHIALDAGLVPGISTVKYLAYNKANPAEMLELYLNFIVEEKPSHNNLYASRYITLQDVYPNPAGEYAYVNYKILRDQVKARIILHNVLGNPVSEYDLPLMENKVKLRTEDLNSGVYFYTLYIDGEAVMTRKLVVKK